MDNMPFPAAFIDDIPQVCILCGIYFSNALSLQYHMRLHTGQESTLFESRPPAVPSTTNSPTNGTITSSLGSNSSGSAVHASSLTPNSALPKQDFELGLEFLNSLTQMYANPSASRENKEKGYDFRYEPNTNSQTSHASQEHSKPSESQKYNFDDFYNSPGDEVLDKKFESVLNFELSKDNGMHFGSLKEPLDVIDEPVLGKEKVNEKIMDNMSQMYHNELKNELDNISNDSIKSDEDEHKFNGIKIPDLPDSENEEKLTAEKPAAKQSVPQEKEDQAKDSPSFDDEIPKVGKFMKIKKYFQSQEMRKKERSSVEKSDVSNNVLQGDEKSDQNLKEAATNLDSVSKKEENENEKTAATKIQDNASSSSDNKNVEKAKEKKSNSPKEEEKETEEHIGINLRSLRKRPNKVEEPDKKKHNVRKRANPRRCVRKEEVDEKLKELAQKSDKDIKETNTKKAEVVTEKDVAATDKDLTTNDKDVTVSDKQPEKVEPVVDRVVTVTEKAENISEKDLVVTEIAEKSVSVLEKDITQNDCKETVGQQLDQGSGVETEQGPVAAVQEQSNKEKVETEISESEDSDVGCIYGQKNVEPLKIKIWKIKPQKKKKHKKKKRKKDKKERKLTGQFEEYTEMDEFMSVEGFEQHHKHKPKRYREKKHTCDSCGQGFGQRCDLRKHEMIHTGERPWVCEICEKTFQRKTDLVKHTRIHTGEKPYECEYCGKKVSDKSQLNVHRRLHTGDRPYQCDVCSKGCITSSELTRHRQTHYSDRPWKCEICQKGFKLRECLAMHMKIHNGTKKYQCAKCGLGFDRESKMEYHMHLHEVDNPYMCGECGSDFENKAHYANHIRSHKRERGPYSCEYCGRLFEHKSSLEPHLRTHTGEKPFICELCNNAYSLKG